MVNSLALYAVCIIGAFFMYMLFSGRVKSGGLITGYTFITIVPLILMIVIPAFILELIILLTIILEGTGDYIKNIAIIVITFEVFAVAMYCFIKLNLSPTLSIFKKIDRDRKKLILNSGRKLLYYCIYGNLLYTVVSLTGISYLIYKNHDTVGYILTHLGDTIKNLMLIPLFMLLMPHMVIPLYFLAIIGISSIITLICILLIMSINGVIRIMYSSEQIRKKALPLVVLMVIPVANVIFMLYLCRLARRELKVE